MFCGIDLGTSSVKASVFDEHGRQLAFSRREIEIFVMFMQVEIQRIIW